MMSLYIFWKIIIACLQMLLLPSSVSFGSEIPSYMYLHPYGYYPIAAELFFSSLRLFSFCTAVWVIPIDLSSNSLNLSLAVFVETSDEPAEDTLHLSVIFIFISSIPFDSFS